MDAGNQIVQDIQDQSKGCLQVIFLAETTSTNDQLKKLAKAGELSKPTVLVTSSQVAGRGTRDRQWFQAAGKDLAFSIAIPFEGDDLRDQRISLAIGAMLAKELEATLEPHCPGLVLAHKWPNDFLLGKLGLKAGGILIETTGGWMVIGIGINLNSLVGDFPASISKGITTIREYLGQELDIRGFTCKLVLGIARSLGVTSGPTRAYIDTAAWVGEWCKRDATGGKQYMLQHGDECIPVTAEGVDFQSGGLICRGADGSTFTVTSYTELEEMA